MTTETASIELILDAHTRDLGGFTVRRTLPSMKRRLVGPFIFFDHMGPASLPPGEGMDVRPHPHIGLATVTFLFDGEIVHRDSLGSVQSILPGDVNWMIAGRGIVHSERSKDEQRPLGIHMHGIQSWVALPLEHEETEPRFEHHPGAATLPRVVIGGATLDVIAGSAFGARSPAPVLSPTLYVHAKVVAGATLTIDDEHEERAVYVVEGTISCDGVDFEAAHMLVLRHGVATTVTAKSDARLMIVGGAHLAGERHIFWNFVSSSEARIERAKTEWQNDEFPKVPGDLLERDSVGRRLD